MKNAYRQAEKFDTITAGVLVTNMRYGRREVSSQRDWVPQASEPERPILSSCTAVAPLNSFPCKYMRRVGKVGLFRKLFQGNKT